LRARANASEGVGGDDDNDSETPGSSAAHSADDGGSASSSDAGWCMEFAVDFACAQTKERHMALERLLRQDLDLHVLQAEMAARASRKRKHSRTTPVRDGR